MSTYAIGDLQGCLEPLLELLDKLNFNSSKDSLWFTGDLINRGPDSLKTLRYIMSLGDKAISVLGNHDLHFLAVAAGHNRRDSRDTFDSLLAAPDLNDLVAWLRSRPLIHYDQSRNMALIHAGLPPQWSIADAITYAHEIEDLLLNSNYQQLLGNMYGNSPTQWNNELKGEDRYRFIINCFTRMRYCTADGHLDFKYKNSPGTQAESLLPWFNLDARNNIDTVILFGHWSTLGFNHEQNTFALDSGCLWGGTLTALNVDNKKTISVKC